MTRGLAEITRLAVKLGANPLTMSGLAGMGDLVLTCTGSLSRNQRVGKGLGQGEVDRFWKTWVRLPKVSIRLNPRASCPYVKGLRCRSLSRCIECCMKTKRWMMCSEDLFSRERRAERDRH